MIDDEDYSTIIEEAADSSGDLAAIRANDNPQQAIRSKQLADASGVPAMVVHADPKGFEERYKANMAGYLVRNSPELQEFIRSHPLAPSIANDDWGNLDTMIKNSRATKETWDNLQSNAWWTGNFTGGPSDVQRAITEGVGAGTPLGSWTADLPLSTKNKATVAAYGLIPELAIRAMGGVFNATVAGTGETAGMLYRDYLSLTKGNIDILGPGPQFTPADEANIELFKRDVSAWAEMVMIQDSGRLPEWQARSRFVKDIEAWKNAPPELKEGLGPGAEQIYTSPEGAQAFQQANRSYQAVKHWVQNGLTPPSNIDPFIDRMHEINNAAGVKQLTDKLADAASSQLRSMDPTLFNQLQDQLYGNSSFGIQVEFINQLYGDRIPTPGDGALGWIPDIEKKLAIARETGDDVRVQVKDWLTHIDPKIAADATPFLRISPEGITQMEAAERAANPPEYPPSIDAPMAAARDEIANQPMFSIGDRKLTLSRREAARPTPELPIDYELTRLTQGERASQTEPGRQLPLGDWELLTNEERQAWIDHAAGLEDEGGPIGTKHHFDLLDHRGNPVANLRLTEVPEGLWVDWIGGKNGFSVHDFGPSLIQDLRRQLRAEFPQFIGKELGGFRVSGARGKFGTTGPVWIKFDVGDAKDVSDLNKFHDILKGGEWQAYHPTIEGYVITDPAKLDLHQAAVDAVASEMQRLAPKGVNLDVVGGLRDTLDTSQFVKGAYLGRRGMNSTILAALDSGDLLGTMRHEVIHHLYRSGFFSTNEWTALQKAAQDNGWLEKYKIAKHYGTDIPHEYALEEAIAEAYQDWAAGRAQFEPHLLPMFQRIKDLFDRIRQRLGEMLGREPTVDDLFQRIESGQVGRRRGELGDIAVPAFSKERVGPDRPPYLDVLDKIRASGVGLDVNSFKKLQEDLHAIFAQNVKAAEASLEKQKRKEDTAAWKTNRAAVKDEVEKAIRARPDVAADLFFSAGDLRGTKYEGPRRIASGDLTEEQKVALPSNYYAKEGLPKDQVANLFGFTSGNAMVESLAKLNEAREGRKESALERTGRMVREQTDATMEKRYGNQSSREDNLMSQAREQALSESDFNLLAQELYGMAAMAKTPVTFDALYAKEQAKAKLADMAMEDIKIEGYRREMKSAGDAAFKALLNGDPAGAIVFKQQQLLNAAYVRVAMELEAIKPGFGRMMQSLRKAKQDTIEPQYTNVIHLLQQRMGITVNRLAANIIDDINKRERVDDGGILKFIQRQATMGPQNRVPDFLLDPDWNKTPDTMTSAEFRATNDAFKMLAHNGRDALKVKIGDEKLDRDAFISDIVSNMKELFKGVPAEPLPKRGFGKWARVQAAGLVKLEALFNRLDQYQAMGPLQELLRGVISASNKEEAKAKEYARIFKDEIADKANLEEIIDNPLGIEIDLQAKKDGLRSGGVQLNRGMLRTIILNASTNSRYFQNWGVEPADVLKWITDPNGPATAADWQWAQKIWTRIWEKTKGESGDMYRGHTGGVTPEWLDPVPIQTPWGVFKGYYPVLLHEEIKGHSAKGLGDMEGILGEAYYDMNAQPPAPHTITRTGTKVPLSLDLNDMGYRLRQVIHDTEMRPALTEAGKVFFDPRIQHAFRLYAGEEYANLLKPYLRDVANAPNFRSEWEDATWRGLEFMRQNAVMAVVGLNPNTFLKHTPTALIQSINEVGGPEFGKAFADMWSRDPSTGESNWQFVNRVSLEYQRRMLNYAESLYGQVEAMSLRKKGWYGTSRDFVMKYSSYPVALGDMVSAGPTFLAAYNKAKKDGLSDEKAIELGDRAIRFAHGSSAVTNRPAVMRGGPAVSMFTSVYNFYSHMWQKTLELKWRFQDAATFRKLGDAEKAKETMDVARFAGMTWAYWLGPAVVGTAVALANGEWKEDEPIEHVFAKQLIHHGGGQIPVVREFTSALVHRSDPQAGMFSTSALLLMNPFRDAMKSEPLSDDHAGKFIQDFTGLIGGAFGLVPMQTGKWLRAIHDTNIGKQEPDFLPQFMRGHERERYSP